MSCTEMFYFDSKGNARELTELHNAWAGAVAVWQALERKYLPPYKPAWARDGAVVEGYSRVTSFDEDAMKDIWALFKRADVEESDKLVLGTTFDNVVVLSKDMPALIAALKKFAECNPQTSIKAQAAVLERLMQDKEKEGFAGIAWNQTSVNQPWVFDYNEDDRVPYNIFNGTRHWSLFQRMEKSE